MAAPPEPAETPPEPPSLAEPELNRLLRQVDWRFLLSQPEAPRVAGRVPGAMAKAVELIASEHAAGGGEADLALAGFPRGAALAAAVELLRPGGEIVCAWRLPRLAGAARARRRLRAAGFVDVTIHWPGPLPWRPPQFWLPLGSDAAASHLLKERPPQTRAQALLRPLWRLAARAELLAPLYAVARLPGSDEDAGQVGGGGDRLGGFLPPGAAPLLLTGGGRSINKVVALPFADGATAGGEAAPAPVGGSAAPATGAVVKFARVGTADAALDREAAALEALAAEHAGVRGVPRLLAQERRVGRRALVESAVRGAPLITALTPASFPRLSTDVAVWLAGLVDSGGPRPASEWWQRLVGEPLDSFEGDFGGVLEPAAMARLRQRLSALDRLPRTCEHRDCSPWNVVLTGDGSPGLLDWESAEPHGLPGLDLAYFLANSAFVLDRTIETGRTRESYRRLLDTRTPYGREAAGRVVEYCAQIGLSPDAFPDLRLLAWVVHARSDYVHREMAAAGVPSADALRTAPYLGLIETDLGLPHAP